jgi:hypothetical protein
MNLILTDFEIERLRALLLTIKAETTPSEGHTDPKALVDCWNEVFDLISAGEK